MLREEDRLQHAVLIDDDHSYIQYGQEKNILKVPGPDYRDFRQCEDELEVYDEEGYKAIPCSLLALAEEEQEPRIGYKNGVLSGDNILVLKLKTGYHIGFLNNQSNQYEQRIISIEKHGQLIKFLDDLWGKESGEESSEIHDTTQLECIRSIVASYGGKTRRVYREINRICYIAGLLFKSMEAAQKENVPLTEVLFRWQFKKKRDFFEPNFSELAFQQQFYLFGLKKLKEVNSGFSLISPKSYFHCIKLPIKEEEERLLEEALSNEGGCVLM